MNMHIMKKEIRFLQIQVSGSDFESVLQFPSFSDKTHGPSPHEPTDTRHCEPVTDVTGVAIS